MNVNVTVHTKMKSFSVLYHDYDRSYIIHIYIIDLRLLAFPSCLQSKCVHHINLIANCFDPSCNLTQRSLMCDRAESYRPKLAIAELPMQREHFSFDTLEFADRACVVL